MTRYLIVVTKIPYGRPSPMPTVHSAGNDMLSAMDALKNLAEESAHNRDKFGDTGRVIEVGTDEVTVRFVKADYELHMRIARNEVRKK